MNYYKNTRGKGIKQDNKGFFAIEQIAAAITLLTAGLFIYNSQNLFGWNFPQITEFVNAFKEPSPEWNLAVVTGTAFGAVAFFSVFIFMFKGRTATFAGLVNRLTSLIAGTSATLISFYFFGGKFPGEEDWFSMVFILIAVAFITKAEKKRILELKINS